MTHVPYSEPEAEAPGSNPFLDKIAARFIVAATSLTDAAAVFDGQDHVTAKGLEDIRWAASSVARSCDAVMAILTHFESSLLTPGGDDLDAPACSAGLQELHLRGLVNAALSGKEIA